jgi:hypothetical protein
MVEVYFHQYESAGENAWESLGFTNPFISEQEIINKINVLNQLLK